MEHMGKRIQIAYRRVEELKPYKNNPRKNDAAVDGVARSIQEFGFKNPIVLGKGDEIVCGHTRLKAALKLGLAEVPCISADDLTEEQIRAYRLADNRTAEIAVWDDELLNIELEAIDLDMTVFGFEEPKPGDVQEDDYDEAPPETPISRLGDLWLLGRHRLLCGDSTDPNAMESLMDGKLADMLLTDAPYNVAYEGSDGKTIMNDNMGDAQFRQFLVSAFSAADQFMKPGAVFYLWHADSEGHNFRGACHDIGWKVRQCLIWHKNAAVLGRQDYHWQHEPCLYGWKEGASHLWASDRKQTTILHYDRPKQNKEHPTMKPVLLFDYQIQNNTKALDLVLDAFAGSGTAIIACEQNNRICHSMELDPRYVDVIVNRYYLYSAEHRKSEKPGDNIFLVRDGKKLAYADVTGSVKAE